AAMSTDLSTLSIEFPFGSAGRAARSRTRARHPLLTGACDVWIGAGGRSADADRGFHATPPTAYASARTVAWRTLASDSRADAAVTRVWLLSAHHVPKTR